MKLVWTKSSLPLSVGIRWFLNSDCSHFAIVFKARDGGLMFESNLLGTHPKFYKTALRHMTVVHEIDLSLSDEQENILWDMIVERFDDSKYNYGGFFYFCWRAFLLKLFKTPLPQKNPWSIPGTFLCEEVFYSLEAIIEKKIGIDLSMISPEKMYLFAKGWVQDASL